MTMHSAEKSGRIMLLDEPPLYDEVGTGQPTSSSMSLSFLSPCLGLRGSGTSGEIERTVTSLIHDIVQPVKPGADSSEQLALDIVSHCARACVAHSVDFSAIIQRPNMENHSPLYWAVVNGRDESLVLALLRHACPLSDAAQSDLRRGCLVVAATSLFDAVSHELHAQMNYSDRMLLTNAPPDVAKVHSHNDPNDGYDVFLEMHCFYKRMVAGRKVIADFITHGRVWRLSFWVAEKDEKYLGFFNSGRALKGQWVVKFETLESAGPEVPAFPVQLSFMVGTTPFAVELRRLYRGDKCVYGYISGYPIQHESAPHDDDVLCATLSVPGPFPKLSEA